LISKPPELILFSSSDVACGEIVALAGWMSGKSWVFAAEGVDIGVRKPPRDGVMRGVIAGDTEIIFNCAIFLKTIKRNKHTVIEV